MNNHAPHLLPKESLKKVFIQQLSILYGAKIHVIERISEFINQATFQNLKAALEEDLEDTLKEIKALKEIFKLYGQSAVTDACIAMDAVMAEADKQVQFNSDDLYASDMTIIFYMDVIEHMQIGAGRILKVLAESVEFKPYQQLITESLDMNKDNGRLFKIIAREYLGLEN